MDYSLLLAIEKLDKNHFSTTNRNAYSSGKEQALYQQNIRAPITTSLRYHFSIIDYLQEFDIGKKMEYIGKTVICKHKDISSVNPGKY
jgi:hypothetical protein